MQTGELVFNKAYGLGLVKDVNVDSAVVEFVIGKKMIRSSFLRPATPEEAQTFTPPPTPEKLTGPKIAKRLIKSFKSGSYTELLEHILAEGSLVIELAKGPSAAEFKAQYFEFTGDQVPEPNSHSVHYWDDRYGNEYRVTFPEPSFLLPEISTSYQTYGAGGKGRLTINAKELFWYMIEQGMRLAEV